jgi:hypothetical protein
MYTVHVFAADGPRMLLQAFFLWQWKVSLMLLLSLLVSMSTSIMFSGRDLCLSHVGILLLLPSLLQLLVALSKFKHTSGIRG